MQPDSINSLAIQSLLDQLKDSPDSGIQQQVQTIQGLLSSLQQTETAKKQPAQTHFAFQPKMEHVHEFEYGARPDIER